MHLFHLFWILQSIFPERRWKTEGGRRKLKNLKKAFTGIPDNDADLESVDNS